MGSATPEDDPPEPGRAVIEDLARAVFPTRADTSRQPDPAEPTTSPEDGVVDRSGGTGVAGAATPVPHPRADSATPLVIDLGVEPATRHVTTFLLVALLVVAVLATAVAYGDPQPLAVALVLGLVVLLAMTWHLRTRRSGATVIVAGGAVDVIGLPGDRHWRVLFHRSGMAPYVVDASMVDPEEFMRVLHAQRSEVTYRPR